MSLLRSTAIRFGNSIPARWKRSLKWQLSIPDAGASLQLLRRQGFNPTHVLDIGTFVGTWTRMCKEIWPAAQVCMFEPQPDKQPRLEALARSMPGVTLKTALLADSAGQEVTFNLSESGSSALPLIAKPTAPTIRLRTQRLSDVVAGTPFARPQLIKVDVQGAELKVLDGAPDVLAAAQFVMLEVALVEEYAGGPLLSEVVSYMAQRDFQVHDICTIFRNTPDQSMNEADIIFARRR
jgi:FkbM family methyltransferase